MNKILYKKMAEVVAWGRDLKQSFTKEQIKQFIKQQAVKMAVRVLAPVAPYIVGGAIIIGVLLAIFFIFYDELAMLWDGVTKTWGHLWSGTASQVSDDDVSILYYDLLQQGVDFEEIGAIGEHNYIKEANLFGVRTWIESFIDDEKFHEEAELKMDQIRHLYTLQYYLDTVTENDLKQVKVNQSKIDYINSKDPDKKLEEIIRMDVLYDSNGKAVIETKREAASRMLSEKLLIFRENEKIDRDGYKRYDKLNVEEGVGVYLKRYLMAEKETFSTRNDFTIVGEGFKGAILVDGGEGEESINDQLTHLAAKVWSTTVMGFFVPIYDPLEDASIDVRSVEKRVDENGEQRMFLKVKTGKSVVDELAVKDGEKKVELAEEEIDIDITEYIERYAMPWQYPFAFHQQTLCPDVGYEVALMAHKYHNLYLQVRGEEKGVLKVFDEGGNLIEESSIIQPKVYLRRLSTWYQTYDYDYSKDPNSAWHGVAKDKATNYNQIQEVTKNTPSGENVDSTAILIVKTITTRECDCGEKDESPVESEPGAMYWDENEPCPSVPPYVSQFEHTTQDSEGNDSICHGTTTIETIYTKNYIKNCAYTYEENSVVTISDTKPKQDYVKLTGVEAMKKLLLPEPEFDPDTNEIINYEEAAKYYRANDISIKTDKNGQTYKKDLLMISTSAQSIIKSLYDLYDGNKYEYEPTDYDDVDSVYSDNDSSIMLDKSTPQYLALEGNYQPVIELIEFFAANGIVDASSIYGLAAANSFAINAGWFISGDSISISSSGNMATLATGTGREVTAPVDGIIYQADNGYIYIKTAKQGSIYLNNIELDSSVRFGQSVTKGQKIGVTTGNVSYYRVDDAGQEVENPAEELKQLQTIKFSDYAWPVPDSGNITSNFGTRVDPITGKVSNHNGVDIGAKEWTPIVAYMDGEIVVAGMDSDGYGNYVKIKHSDDSYTLYGHMVRIAKSNGMVKKNEVIGYVGSTGRSTGPHLHFEYRTGPDYNDAINPMSQLSNYSYY